MNLKSYLIKNRLEPAEFAVEFKKRMKKNISIASIYRYINGKRMHLSTAKAIEKFTENAVTVEELMGIDE